MAKSIDDLIEFILEEIALCGAQGAGSADFRRFIEQFHKENEKQAARDGQERPHFRIDRVYLEKVWEWVRINQDVRMVYANETRSLSLSDFEALELQETGANESEGSTHRDALPTSTPIQPVPPQLPSSFLQTSFRDALRQRLSNEAGTTHTKPADQQAGIAPRPSSSSCSSAHSSPGTGKSLAPDSGAAVDSQHRSHRAGGLARQPIPYATVPGQTGVRITGNPFSARRPKRGTKTTGPIFDDLTPSTTAPRIYVSQNRTWQAVAGHSMDFKRLSAMKFVLLSIIASRGPEGINQPELTALSGQDKRSVPARTDELAKDGYIEKSPVASPNGPTSRCVHKRFIKGDHYLRGAGNHQDVFRGRTVIFAQLVALIYSALKDVKILPFSQLREKLGISHEDLNTTGFRSAIRRLEETGFLAKKRIWKTGTRKTTTIVLQILREPNDDDVKNFRFRYQNTIRQPSNNGAGEDEEEGDDGMGDLDLELDLAEEGTETKRIPPQWTPERPLPNLFFQAVELSGPHGVDAAGLRDRTMGKFWRRPTESYLARMTDNWETSQPPHLRHLALIRDTRITNEKKIVHYVYRTHDNFQKAVDDKLANWDAVSRETSKRKKSGEKGQPSKPNQAPLLNEWGFPDIPNDLFLLPDGSATLVQCSKAANTGREKLELWANMKTIGFRKRTGELGSSSNPIKRGRPKKVSEENTTPQASESLQATAEPSSPDTPAVAAEVGTSVPVETKVKKAKRPAQLAVPLLSKEQREALGLPPRGRLGQFIEDQIRKHRQRTGDPVSLPDVIYKNPADVPRVEQETAADMNEKKKGGNGPRLFTREFRRQHGLPEKGRLSQAVMDRFRRLEREGTLDGQTPEADATMGEEGSTEPQQDETARVSTPPEIHVDRPMPTSGTKRKADIHAMPQEAVKRLRRGSGTPAASIEQVSSPITAGESLAPEKSIDASATPKVPPPQAIESQMTDKTTAPPPLIAPVTEQIDTTAPVWSATPPPMPETPKSRGNTEDLSTAEQQTVHVRTSVTPTQRDSTQEIRSDGGQPDGESTNGVFIVPRIPAAPSYKHHKPAGAFSKKAVVRARGSNWYARVDIIIYILKMCGGVYPLHGELIEPFHRLWAERVPNENKPDRTTLSNTINAMMEDPDYGLQKFGFWVSTRSSQARSQRMERFMLALPEIDPSHPKVQEMKNKMAERYPHKCYPPEVQHLVPPEGPARGPRKPRFDASLTLDGRTPNALQRVNQQIYSSAEKRREQAEKKKAKEHKARVAVAGRGVARGRLEGLAARPARKEKGWAEVISGRIERERGSGSEEETPLSRSHLRDAFSKSPSPHASSTEDVEMESGAEYRRPSLPMGSGDDGFRHLTVKDFQERQLHLALLDSGSHYYGNIGTFSTDFAGFKAPSIQWVPIAGTDETGAEYEWTFVQAHIAKGVKRKRVQFEDIDESPKKRASHKRARTSPEGPLPTVVERLSGRMGNADDPVYVPPTKKSYRTPKPWADMRPSKRRRGGEDQKVQKPLYMKDLHNKPDLPHDAAETFKKLFCTLAIAYSMSGQRGVDWAIPSKVYEGEPRFNVDKIKKLWAWVQKNMEVQLRTFTASFEKAFLEAYENGTVDVLEDPESYKWAALVRWALIKCDYSEPPLPRIREALQHYSVEESSYKLFDRSEWATKELAHVRRADRLLKFSYAAPLHAKSVGQREDDVLRARSWIRSNIATPEQVYNSQVAHDKLELLGERTLELAIADMTREKQIRMRKIKRLLPGRNFHFATSFAIKYRKPFESDVFIDAVNFKKSLDATFAHADPEKRIHSVSRTADDGSVMALMSLVAAGQVRIEPVLPPIKNELRAPEPRISVWGFIEGDYVHRKIDRKRLFWEIHAVPTGAYEFGNPLKPSSAPGPDEEKAEWQTLPEPPLPGKTDRMAKQPIWSTIDGTGVIWPWWYRVLNLVLQGLMFQPGSSARDLHSYCPGGSVEPFEVELVLEWLVSVGAAERHGAPANGGAGDAIGSTDTSKAKATYTTTPGFWAVFGEELTDMEGDAFNEHVKRTKPPEYRQAWKYQFNLRSARISGLLEPQEDAGSANVAREGEGESSGGGSASDEGNGESGQSGGSAPPPSRKGYKEAMRYGLDEGGEEFERKKREYQEYEARKARRVGRHARAQLEGRGNVVEGGEGAQEGRESERDVEGEV